MRALRQRASVPLRFSGVGGREMAEAGLDSLLPIDDFSIIGFAAIPRAAAANLHHMYKTVRAVLAAPAACAGHHRQPGLYASGRALGASLRPFDPDRRLRLAVGLGLAAGPGPLDAALHRPCAGAAAVRARRASQAWRAALQLCRPSADRGGRKLRPNDAEAHAAARRSAGRAGDAGQPQRRGGAARRRSSAKRWAWCSSASARSRWWCRRCRICSPR